MLPIERLAGPERPPAATSRRRFLVGAAVGRCRPQHRLRPAARRPRPPRASGAAATNVVTPFDGFVRIAPDNTVTVLVAHLEMGQGPYTGLATLVAEELDADWSQMRAEGAPAQRRSSTATSPGAARPGHGRLDRDGELLRAAAQGRRARRAPCWSRPPPSSGRCRPSEITVEKGVLTHAVRQARHLSASSPTPRPSRRRAARGDAAGGRHPAQGPRPLQADRQPSLRRLDTVGEDHRPARSTPSTSASPAC